MGLTETLMIEVYQLNSHRITPSLRI